MLTSLRVSSTRGLRTTLAHHHHTIRISPCPALPAIQSIRAFHGSARRADDQGPSQVMPVSPSPSNPDIQREYRAPSEPLHPPRATKYQKAQQIATGQMPRETEHAIGNREDAPPKHEMVYFASLLKRERKFGAFRSVLHTGLYSQVVAMEVPVGGEIGDEVHTVDQVLLFTSGTGIASVGGRDQDVRAGDVVVVPAGTQHQFVTTGRSPLEIVTIYSPAEHAPDSVHDTKEEGDAAEAAGSDEAPAWARRPKKENEDAGLVNLSGTYENEPVEDSAAADGARMKNWRMPESG